MKKLEMEAPGIGASIPVPDNFSEDSKAREQVIEDYFETALLMSLFGPPSKIKTTIRDITNKSDKTPDLK